MSDALALLNQNGCMSDAVDNAASGTDDYDGTDKNTTTIANMLTTMTKPIMRTMLTILHNMTLMIVTFG